MLSPELPELAHGLRLQQVTYPNGRVVFYQYGYQGTFAYDPDDSLKFVGQTAWRDTDFSTSIRREA